MRLKDKVAIITGGANGIGLAACEQFASEGAKVVMADYDEEAGAVQQQVLREKGLEVTFIHVNVACRDSVQSTVSKTVKLYGGIDILVNNAGIIRDAMLAKMELADFQQVMDVNVTGVFNCTQAVLPFMLEKNRGKIINTSSVSGLYGNVGQTNYAASKAAVVGMTKSWAKELGRKGINVNAVSPGFTQTAMVGKMPETVVQQISSMNSLQRLGKPSDIAKAYLFLASSDSDYVQGHVLEVDGGIMI